MGGVGDGLLSPCEGDCSPSSSLLEGDSTTPLASLSSGSSTPVPSMLVSGRLLTKLPCCLGGFKTFLTALLDDRCQSLFMHLQEPASSGERVCPQVFLSVFVVRLKLEQVLV